MDAAKLRIPEGQRAACYAMRVNGLADADFSASIPHRLTG